MSLPEPYRPTEAGQRHPMPGWPTEPAVIPAAVELYGERIPVTWVQSAVNPSQSVAIDARLLQPYQPTQARDLSPQPLLDPIAARMGCAGIGGGAFAAGVGWGAAQVLSAAASSITGLAVLAAILVAARITSGGRGSTHITQTVHHHNRWWGKSTTNL